MRFDASAEKETDEIVALLEQALDRADSLRLYLLGAKIDDAVICVSRIARDRKLPGRTR